MDGEIVKVEFTKHGSSIRRRRGRSSNSLEMRGQCRKREIVEELREREEEGSRD